MINRLLLTTLFLIASCVSSADNLSSTHKKLLIGSDTQWKYFASPKTVKSDWKNKSFDDSSWRQGKSGFGSNYR